MSTAVEGGLPEPRVNGHGPHLNGSAGALEDAALPWEHQLLTPTLHLDDKTRALKIERRLAGLALGGGTLRRVAEVFLREMDGGLQGRPSSLQMENTYVPELPDGTEEGMFLALDLGGTKFRVLVLELRGGRLLREQVQHYHINDTLRLGPGEDLFNFLADCVQDFLRSEGLEDEELPLGFTFSFPMRQHSISSGELITWTKSFKCAGMEGVDVAALLQRYLAARGLRVTVQVLLNDTTGTLVAGAFVDPDAAIGVILGTGSNGCYMERAERVQHWEGTPRQGAAPARDVAVDIEWGAFGDNGCLHFLRTEFDTRVDDNSLLPTSFTFEKYISGKYLGDLVCAALSALAQDGLLPAEPRWGSLDTTHVSLFEEESLEGAWAQTCAALSAASGAPACRQDALVAQHAARLVSNRAAQLVSVCIATLLRRMDRAHAAVAVDGSLFKKHPRFSSLMEKYITMLAPKHKFTLLGAEDGSGKGSAITAAVAARIAAREP